MAPRLGVVLVAICALGGMEPALAQQQVRLCFSVTGQTFCTLADSTNRLPAGAGTGGAGTGGAVQIRLCYVVPGSPFCQIVDATHPLPVSSGGTPPVSPCAGVIDLSVGCIIAGLGP
jgi:hypothetical protein